MYRKTENSSLKKTEATISLEDVIQRPGLDTRTRLSRDDPVLLQTLHCCFLLGTDDSPFIAAVNCYYYYYYYYRSFLLHVSLDYLSGFQHLLGSALHAHTSWYIVKDGSLNCKIFINQLLPLLVLDLLTDLTIYFVPGFTWLNMAFVKACIHDSPFKIHIFFV